MSRNRNEEGKFDSEVELDEYQEFYQDYAERLVKKKENQATIDQRKKGVRYWVYWCDIRSSLVAIKGELTRFNLSA